MIRQRFVHDGEMQGTGIGFEYRSRRGCQQ